MSFKNSFSTGHHCAVYGCSNNQKKRNAARKQLCGKHNVVQEECGCNIYLLHRFPADADLKRQWIAAVNRKDFVPSSSSRVCSMHFVDGKRSDQNPVPMLRLGYERKVLKGRRRLVKYDSEQPKKKRTAENLPPTSLACSLHLDTGDTDFLEDASGEKDDASSEGLRLLCAAASMKEQDENAAIAAANAIVQLYPIKNHEAVQAAPSGEQGASSEQQDTGSNSGEQDTGSEQQDLQHTGGEQQEWNASRNAAALVRMCDRWTQWEDNSYEDHTYVQHFPIGFKGKSFAKSLSSDDILFYTGQSQTVFERLVRAVSILAKKPSVLTRADQLLLCLMRLRLGLLYGHLARIFQISVSTVSNYVSYMLSLLCKVMKKVVIWLPKSHIRNSMPDSFIENKHDDTTCILDCTEVFLQRPKKLMARAQTFSSYKAHNTVKFLVAIAPNGFIMFVSKAYGGRASDKFITNSSGISDYLVHGDVVMADRGFALTDEMQLQGVRLNTPAFTKGKPQLSDKEVTSTRRIASVRIHVERAINRIKTYRIFKQALPIRSKKSISNMVFVCAGLCNMKSELIKKPSA
ncbi:uncharacterized protein LOC142576388 [Dermacentor variabilis]|uniref:uncharacterized protein LOC142576388 n=1 Tax=Dermacentor variabilis TaxID=34621 RepID=UPI003F5B3FE1